MHLILKLKLEVEKLKKSRDKQVKTWTEQRDKIHAEKLQEIEEAHNKWLNEEAERRLEILKNLKN